MLKEIIQERVLTNTNITLLINKIVIKETDEIGEYNRPKLDIEIVWNMPFVNISKSYYGVAV